ncbi:MAG: hypothetical protein H6577_03000 [Lewinellaceae bacterium]|nr:hypothetical protein [Saprospiraceae bacterium]MCB9337079.1 hypothetical protein [Lewinellaceae bacterium]
MLQVFARFSAAVPGCPVAEIEHLPQAPYIVVITFVSPLMVPPAEIISLPNIQAEPSEGI